MAYTQTDPFNPVNTKPKPELGPNDYGKPMGKPLPRPERRQPGYSDGSGFDFNAWKTGKKRKPLPGQGPMPVGTKPLPSPVVKDTRGDLGGYKPDYGDENGGWVRDKNGNYRGGQPPWLEGQMLPMDIGPGSANERAQASLKAQWEAKNGPWQGGQGGMNDFMDRSSRVNPDALKGLQGQAGFGGGMQGRSMPISQVPQNIQDLWANGGKNPYGDMKPGGGQGGEQIGGAVNVGGGKPQLNNPYTSERQYGGPSAPPVGTGPGSMGKPQQPSGGRQPLRPGMEYRPGGGQRPVGGGRNGGPQMILPDESGQYQPEALQGQALDDYNAIQGRAALWQQNGGQGTYSETSGPGQEDPQAQMRRKLMQMQNQGPMNNQYYGAF